MELFHFHLFVCTQEMPEGVVSCPSRGSHALLDALDREIEAFGLGRDAQVTTCGCIGLCEEGPVMIVYPAGVWYRRVQPSDIPEIVQKHLRDGEPVERLVWNDAARIKAMSVEHGEQLRRVIAAREKAGTLSDRLNEMIRSFMPSRCILTALELDLFTAVGDGAKAEQVGSKIKANARATGMLLNALVALGLLVKSGDDYRNTPETARYFVQGSKDNQRNGLLLTAAMWHCWSTLNDAVRCGTRIPIDRSKTPEWTRDFIAAMDLNARDSAALVVKALGTTGVRRILDLGGGSGAYSIAFAQASADVKCEILDLPEVVPLTAEYLGSAGVSAQVDIRAGNMFHDAFGSGYDIVMLNSICHMFSEGQNREIFRRARQALSPNGRLVVQDFILNPDKAGPQHAALFSLNMLVDREAGSCYDEQEYTDWMKAAGFDEVRRINLPGPCDLIVGRVK